VDEKFFDLSMLVVALQYGVAPLVIENMGARKLASSSMCMTSCWQVSCLMVCDRWPGAITASLILKST
jgi:hypothetical protein